MDLNQEIQEVEKELLELIIEHLRNNRLEVAVARQQARDFLALLPVNDKRDLLAKLKTLGEKYEEAKEVYADELAKFNDQARDQALNQMRDFIKQGNLEQAVQVAKNVYAS